MIQRVRVQVPSGPYDVWVGRGAVARLAGVAKSPLAVLATTVVLPRGRPNLSVTRPLMDNGETNSSGTGSVPGSVVAASTSLP